MAKILIIDDAMFMRKVLSDLLTKQGHIIVGEGATAKEAIELHNKRNPDLLTLDVVMPEEDGITTLNALKSIKKNNPNTQILIVSAMGQEVIKRELLNAGAEGFITKPFQEAEIAEVIKKILNE